MVARRELTVFGSISPCGGTDSLLGRGLFRLSGSLRNGERGIKRPGAGEKGSETKALGPLKEPLQRRELRVVSNFGVYTCARAKIASCEEERRGVREVLKFGHPAKRLQTLCTKLRRSAQLGG